MQQKDLRQIGLLSGLHLNLSMCFTGDYLINNGIIGDSSQPYKST